MVVEEALVPVAKVLPVSLQLVALQASSLVVLVLVAVPVLVAEVVRKGLHHQAEQVDRCYQSNSSYINTSISTTTTTASHRVQAVGKQCLVVHAARMSPWAFARKN